MERATFSVLYYIKRTKKLKDGTCPIYARITVNLERVEFSLKKSVNEGNWDSKREKVKGFSKEAKKINSYFDTIKRKLYEIKIDLEEQDIPVTASKLKDVFLGVNEDEEEEEKTILGVFQEHNERCERLIGKDCAKATHQRYVTCYLHLERFMGFMYGQNDMPLKKITPKFINDFEFYLKTERNCNHNTTTKYLKNFKKIIRIALANGWLKKDPFINIKFRLKETNIDFLTTRELNILMKKEFKIERVQQVRDVYLFCCFTGLAFADVKSLSYDEIQKINGKLWIKKRRQKTKSLCSVPLMEPALQIINKYKNNPYCIKNNRVLPVYSNQKMNAYLKEIADLCGIKKKLSTHTARHTFATTVTLSNHVSIEVVSKMLGHSSINMTKRYARVVDDLVMRDMQKIDGKYSELQL